MIYMEQPNPKTLTWLKSNGWYRFLKVSYLLALLVALAFFNAVVFSAGRGQPVNQVFVYGNLIILAIFEIIRRIFYYVVLGKVIPGK